MFSIASLWIPFTITAAGVGPGEPQGEIAVYRC